MSAHTHVMILHLKYNGKSYVFEKQANIYLDWGFENL